MQPCPHHLNICFIPLSYHTCIHTTCAYVTGSIPYHRHRGAYLPVASSLILTRRWGTLKDFTDRAWEATDNQPMRCSMQHHVTWAKGSCYRDADRVKSVLCVSVFMCVHDVCFVNPLSRRGLNHITTRGVMCERQVGMCVQMAERRAAASTQKLSPPLFSYSTHEPSQPWGEKKYMYLFECMDMCLPDNPCQKCAGLHHRGDFLLHTYLNRVFIYRLLSHNIIVCPIIYMSSIFFSALS